MDVTPALFTVAVTVSSMMPGAAAPATQDSLQSIREALVAAPIPPAIREAAQDLATPVRPAFTPPISTRPAPLVPMYASLIVLQGLDVYVTSSAVQSGAREANPIMKPVATNHAASIAVKAAATAGAIFFTERAWKQSRKGAVILMTAINVATAAVVAHNTQVARRR
jgi:hypothetical protein